ncbi:AMP-binding protein [Streptomyces sp. NPDC014864]|uniref:AMP-binding protein n=1 Tax=Streptomyces sp. NPDC014864 TaxID=3364924 RepID=UPI0036FF9A14
MTGVLDPVRRHAAATPDHIALRGATDQWAYLQLRDASMRYAGALAAAGLSSGEAGRPKGARLTVGNLLSAGEIGAECSRASSADRTGTGLPLFRMFGRAAVMMATLTLGGSMSLPARSGREPMLDMLRRDRLTLMAGVPTMWNALLHEAGDANPADFAGLRVAVSGGASVPGGRPPGPSWPASAVLHEHPDVVEAAVIGVPDELYGEEVAALVAARSGSRLGAAEVSSWARQRLSTYKTPRIVRFVDALPKGPTGRILTVHRPYAVLTRDTAPTDVAARRH